MYIVSFHDSTLPQEDSSSWMADLDPQTLSNAIEWVYTAFFCSTSSQQLRNTSEEVLLGCFVTMLNDTFEQELTLGDKGYDSGSESLSIPTPLCTAPYLYHISPSENLSFGPATPWAYSSQWPDNLKTVHCHLMFDEDDNSLIDSNPLNGSMEWSSLTEHPMAHHITGADKEEEVEHFPTASLSDDVWMEEPVPDRHLCIHEHSQLHDLCPYACQYSLDQPHLVPEYTPTPQYMDVSDIFDFPDVMTTSSNEDIPNLEGVLEL